MARETIGRGTWIDKVAHELIERERKLGRNLDLIITESGLGASGIPHIGSIADAIRAYAITLALRDMGYSSKSIAFSDDMDGLRKVPAGLPDWLERHLLKPVSMIPDPFGCHESYGVHMSSMLTEALDALEVDYERIRAYDVYGSGKLAPYIERILLNWRKIGEKIEELIGQDKFKRVLPYFPICEQCGRIYTAQALSYDKRTKKVHYVCRDVEVKGRLFRGCGYEGEADIRRRDGKLSWKVEFAARWALLDVRFEAYGKDIADSVKVNDWVSDEILNFPPPMHVRYEMFLDKLGRKISKSAGNVFTPQLWLRYGSPESLILFMLKRFKGTRRISLDTIRKTMIELDMLKDVYFGRMKETNRMRLMKIRGLLEYTNHLKGVKDYDVPFNLILNLASMAPRDQEIKFILTILRKYGYPVDKMSEDLTRKIKYAIRWVRDIGKVAKVKVKLNETERKALKEIKEKIEIVKDGNKLQEEIFNIIRRHKLEPRNFFPKLYQILIGTKSGPKAGPLIIDMGRERVIELIDKYVGPVA
ncbi:lysine--tRNA ligase [Candidatus Geothermarchaeota archaeon]|nr:MAG: lysine--tRNA ligase [Candidatus Geothermarchaeota archaeon]